MIGEHAHGNIFDLEDSPDIQSHLRALDLYRALKPGAIPPERMVIVQAKRDPLRIKIKRSKSDNAFSRELLISPKGDVLREIFYSADGKPSTEILRSEFKEIKGVATSKSFFPLRIEIVTELKKTILQFKQLQLLSEVQDSDFELVLPENTRRVTL